MALKPWYNVVTLREDLRTGESLDASEFAVHLDQIRDKRSAVPVDYRDPARFFDRTYPTATLKDLAVGVVRRLAGIRAGTSPVYNLTTQFGGGKTHALALLYHLATGGPAASEWKGVSDILKAAGIIAVPTTAVAAFVGLDFDSLEGRGGKNGEPLRKTPWGEIAFQLGQEAGYAVVARHDQEGVAPSGEVIRKFLPKDRPALILMDELMNYVSRNRASGLGAQLYNFLQNLSEEVRGQDNVVLAVSLPASELEMSADDHADYDRINKLLQRLGKALMLSAGDETSEIIRRRLFEWGGLPVEARTTAAAYAEWIRDNRKLLPTTFPAETAADAILASYPFHPTVLSVFERKWQGIPQFQRTRGVLRMLALWISYIARNDYKNAYKDPLITLGTAPLADPVFRQAIFGQLGSDNKLEVVVTTDIAGKLDSHALRLDKDATDAIKKARLHQKVATVIFFESNGGQAKNEATLPEVRLAVAEPSLDIGNVETVLENLMGTCYYLSGEKNRYRFSTRTNLNRIVADRRAAVSASKVERRVREAVAEVFNNTKDGKTTFATRVLFPEKTSDIADRAALTLVVMPPETGYPDKQAQAFIETATRECGASNRTFKSALFWSVPGDTASLQEAARKLLAWEEIEADLHDLKLDDPQKRQLADHLRMGERDLKEAVWRTYRFLILLKKDGTLRTVDLGQVHSSQKGNISMLLAERLSNDGEVVDRVGINQIVRNWSGAFKEWSTKSVRDAFYSSPQLPRVTDADAIKITIAEGANTGQIAYVGKALDGSYEPFHWKGSLKPQDVELSEDMFIVQRDVAEAYSHSKVAPPPETTAKVAVEAKAPERGTAVPVPPAQPPKAPSAPPPPAKVNSISWRGEIPAQKWMNFYMKVLTKVATLPGLKLTLRIELAPPSGVPAQSVEEMRVALRELGLDERIDSD